MEKSADSRSQPRNRDTGRSSLPSGAGSTCSTSVESQPSRSSRTKASAPRSSTGSGCAAPPGDANKRASRATTHLAPYLPLAQAITGTLREVADAKGLSYYADHRRIQVMEDWAKYVASGPLGATP